MLYKTSGVCCSEISFEVEDNIVKNVIFIGGCSGNTAGISKLVAGMSIDEVITRLEGTKCGFKSTSCPDQLTKALKEWKK
ncbi:TIGR03905 family TSCPD domain-containing protein [Anaerocolumna sp. AGMB13025]|uniref:TIGR03905 family TSCPD domain-containing protein n=1 Tax=Anaerocolumna sp. AGMB13025 TaxID=3039116 RepID=UPI00241F1A20|nr:TIGR03905 family TSCPD domain-containing protein [Anaerocolumna sp. AGMB13025]WFR57565.1 TIGR03905 family TSCPD domain-containing protein [Anaerocolumna sp. AGMB13025]